MQIKTTKVNDYSIKATIVDDNVHKNILFVNNDIKYMHWNKMKRMYGLSKLMSILLYIFAMIYAIGIVGHDDYILKYHLNFDWGFQNYLVHVLLCLSLITIGYVFRYVAVKFKTKIDNL